MQSLVKRARALVVTVLLLAALLAVSAGPAAGLAGSAPATRSGPQAPQSIGNEWQAFLPGVAGDVAVMVNTGADIYVGGHFSQAGALPVNNIARWNLAAHQWFALGSGVTGPGFYTNISAILVDGSDVYIGGDFGAAGGATANHVARWNTTTNSWHALGAGASNGVDSPVYALAQLGSAIYVGGRFQQAGGAPAHGLARWDPNGNTWSRLGSGPSDGVHGIVFALAAAGADLYVGGGFDRAGVISTTNVARWNGGWSSLGRGIDSNNFDYVQSLVISGTTLFAGGIFNSASDGVISTTAQNVAAWNISQHTWSALGTGVVVGLFTGVTALAAGPQGLFAAGSIGQAGAAAVHNVARWNGSQWSALADTVDGGEGVDDIALTLSVLGSDVYVGGVFRNAGIRSALGLAHWDAAGQHWFTLGNGVNSYLTALAVSGDDVYLGGDFTSAGGLAASHVARWNRRTNTWSNLAGGVTGCRKTGGSCSTPAVNAIVVRGTDVYVGGNFSAAGGVAANSLARWDTLQNKWMAAGSGVSCAALNCQPAVDALYSGAGGLYAGGAFDHAGGSAANNIARWDGNAWHSLNGPGNGVNGPVYALAGQGSLVYAGGQFSLPAANLAAFDGAHWTGLGQPLNGLVEALALVGGNLYVGGQFTNAGGSGANYLAYLIGASGGWQALSGAVNGPVYTLAAQGSTLLAGGAFTQTGGLVTNHVAEWDTLNSQWVALNYGVDTTVRALAAAPDQAFVGGDFAAADGRPDFYFTAWGPGAASVGGFAASDPDCLGMFGDYLACAVTGADGQLWLKEYANGAWSQWVRANIDPTQPLRSGPTLTGWGAQTPAGRPSQLNAFARFDGGLLQEGQWTAAGWSRWYWFPGAPLASSSPDCISRTAGQIDCFYRNAADSALATATISDNVLLGYADLGGSFTSGPGASTWGPGRYDLFGRGSDNQLYHAYYEGGWSGYVDGFTGVVYSDPDCVSRGVNVIDCVVLGASGQAQQLNWNGAAWTYYTNLGGHLRGGPTIASLGAGNLNVFAWGQDCHFYQRIWSNGLGWSAWTDLGGDARVTGLCNQVFIPVASR